MVWVNNHACQLSDHLGFQALNAESPSHNRGRKHVSVNSTQRCYSSYAHDQRNKGKFYDDIYCDTADVYCHRFEDKSNNHTEITMDIIPEKMRWRTINLSSEAESIISKHFLMQQTKFNCKSLITKQPRIHISHKVQSSMNILQMSKVGK